LRSYVGSRLDVAACSILLGIFGTPLRQDGKHQLIVGVGGFLGLGERRVAIPSGNVAMRGDRLILENITEEQLKRMPPVDRNSRELRDIDGNATIELSSR
jgi:hypothetical protein